MCPQLGALCPDLPPVALPTQHAVSPFESICLALISITVVCVRRGFREEVGRFHDLIALMKKLHFCSCDGKHSSFCPTPNGKDALSAS